MSLQKAPLAQGTAVSYLMAMKCSEHQLGLLSAARRHVSDAERLATESPDQSWHLAGFGPECARKALIFEPAVQAAVLNKALGHDFSGVADENLLDWVMRLDPWAHRYSPSSWAREHAILTAWKPQHRYEATGTAFRAG